MSNLVGGCRVTGQQGRGHVSARSSDVQGVTHPVPRPSRRRQAWITAAIVGLGIAFAFSIANSGPDMTPTEQQFVDHQRSSLDVDEVLRYGHAVCDVLDTGGVEFTAEWLAGIDDLSRAGAVRPNPDPISMYDARQIATAADGYLC